MIRPGLNYVANTNVEMTDPTQPQNPAPTTATQPADESNQPTTQNLDTLLGNAKNVNKTSVWGYIVWSLLLPPFSLILTLLFALRRGAFFVVLPSVTIAFSFLALISPVFIYFLFGPIHVVTTQFTLRQNIYSDPKLTITSMLLTVLAIVGIILGIYFRRRAKHSLTLEPLAVAILIAVLVFEHVIFWVNLNSAARVISKQAQIIFNQQGVPY